MSWRKKLERGLTPFAIPHLTLWLVVGQTFFYLTFILGLINPIRIVFAPVLVEQGEFWRIVTFLFLPPVGHAGVMDWVFFAFIMYFFYFTGSTLEGYWGTLRYNLFILTGYLLTVGLAFVTPNALAENLFIGGSVFLAFAYLHPEFVIYVLMVLPVKIKWVALLTWALYAWTFVTGGLAERLSIVAAAGNFLLFFGRDLWLDLRAGRRRLRHQARRSADGREQPAPRHRCHVCGKDSNTYPQMDFRYCSKCAGAQCYCPEHIYHHVHVLNQDEPPKV
mgnify:CR=1 FL=1